MDHKKNVENFKRGGNTRSPYLPSGKPISGQEAQLELDVEQRTVSKLGKECVKAVCCHPAYLIYMQNYIMQNARLDESQAEINQDCQEKCQ